MSAGYALPTGVDSDAVDGYKSTSVRSPRREQTLRERGSTEDKVVFWIWIGRSRRSE
jgi:hypothetical protein